MPKDTKTLCIKKGCASVLTQPLFRLCKLDTIIPRFGVNKEGISLNYL